MEIGEHHQRDGLTFRRNDDGSVRIRVYGNGQAEAPTFEQTIPAPEWESVLRETSWASLHTRVADTAASVRDLTPDERAGLTFEAVAEQNSAAADDLLRARAGHNED